MGISIPHFRARAGALPLGKAEAATTSRTCPKRKRMSDTANTRSNYFPSSPASRNFLRVTKFHTMTIAVAPIFVMR